MNAALRKDANNRESIRRHADIRARFLTLSGREKEVLQSLVDGNSYKMVAAEMGISVDTVRSHIRNIYDKLHVNSKSEAVAKALKDRIV